MCVSKYICVCVYVYRCKRVVGEREGGWRGKLEAPPLRSVTVRRHERVHGGRDRIAGAAGSTAAAVHVFHGDGDDAVDGRGGRRWRRRSARGRGGRAERPVRRTRGPSGGRGDRRQRAGDRGVPSGTAAPSTHQLLHHIAGHRRPPGRYGGHPVRRAVQRRAAPSPAPVHVHRVADHRAVHRVHTQPSGRVRRPVLGHSLPDGLLHQFQHQNRHLYVPYCTIY